ncbi:TonB-dependent receptor [Sphingomonas sp. KC8]|uniref:TonB-dependent receptor n=1 Tax=Sphingomonas sp. KC8 TaxID=1030157 RepID=UPI000248A06D|nr:TonB-dependent receptor [Sphingomonas sp. KC8]ARS27669.1 TonB-dependent receptor [Sphingomonas sp. KC8]
MQYHSRKRLKTIGVLVAATILSGPAFAGTLAGTISDSSGTSGLEGAEVEIEQLRRRTSARADGSFRFSDVPAGRYSLRTRYAGAEDKLTEVDVTATGTTETSIALSAGKGALDTILVIGQQANLGSSIARQRAADGVATVLTRDAIGQFPDQNVAEALRRSPGINILNDQGEGRFVSVRGLDPNLNSASINGSRIPSPESDVRSVALDVIPSELVESIEIKKSLTPDMDGDTIGASIEINTTSAFDRKKPFVAISAEGSYNDLNEKLSPKGSVDFATRLGDDFGIAGGLSYYRRKFATDNIEMEGWDEDNGVPTFEKLEYRDYDVTRERIGGSLSFDWRASDTTELYARGLYSRFEDQEYRRRLIFDMGDASPVGGTANGPSYLSGGADDSEIKVERDLKDRNEVQTIRSYALGGKTETGPWAFKYEASLAKSGETENGSIDPAAFERTFDGDDVLGVDFDFGNYKKPAYSITQGNDLFLDPAGYEFDKIERTTLSKARDREYTLRADITRSFALGQGEFDVQFGGKARLRKKTYDLQLDVFDGYDGDLTLADVLGRQDYGLAVIDPVVGKTAVRDLVGDYSAFERNALDSEFESNIADFSVKEDIYAGYLLGRYDSTALRIIGGVRVEHTKNDIRANLVELVEEGGVHNGVTLDEDTVFVTPNGFKRSYTDWLPSLNLRFAPAQDIVLRAAAFKSVVRPNIAKLAPRFVVEESDDGDREGEFGNPALKPYKAWNVDASVEYYFGKNAVVQAGVFWKRIDNFIVDREFDEDDAPYNGVYNGVSFSEAVIPINGDRATVKGLELSYQQALTFLPAPLDGFLVNFNYTYTDAKGDIGDRTIPLPASSKHTFNAILGYEKGPLSLRVAGAYRSGYLDELGGDADEDRYVRKHFQLDLSGKYRVTKNIQIFAELVNGLDAPYIAYQKGPGRDRLLQYEEYSWTGKFGVRANF